MLKSEKDEINERSRAEWEELIFQWIHNEVDRKMLVRRLLDGVLYDDLAEEFGLSPQQTKKRLYEAKEQLFRHIK